LAYLFTIITNFQIYEHFSDEVTVFTGLENSRRFFLIDKFRGTHRLGLWDGEECDSVYGASEGVSYPQFLTRNDTLLYLRKTICRATPLYYRKDESRYGMHGLRFELPSNLYASPDERPQNACFRRRGDFSPQLPSGATDVSPCFYSELTNHYKIKIILQYYWNFQMRCFE
jgi:hypothetical protein